jgi:hypothetical protein
MKYELIDVAGNRWFVEAPDYNTIRNEIRNGLELEATPYGLKDEHQYSQWYLCGDKVVSFRRIE